MLDFCKTCNNLLEVVFADGVASHVCANCNETVPVASNALLYEETKATETVKQLTPYAMDDPTLPVFNNIACPSTRCPSQSDASLRAVASLKIDDVNLVFAYKCKQCQTKWTQ